MMRKRMTWEEITREINKSQGTNVCRQSIQGSYDRLLRKLRRLLIKDPVIKDWLIEQGIDIEDDTAR